MTYSSYADPNFRKKHNAQAVKWRKENPERARATVDAHQQRRREALNALKSEPCTDCGLKFPPCAMDFDHVRGEKKIRFNKAVSSYKWEDILTEIKEKCELVCANCHRIRTFNRKQYVGTGRT